MKPTKIYFAFCLIILGVILQITLSALMAEKSTTAKVISCQICDKKNIYGNGVINAKGSFSKLHWFKILSIIEKVEGDADCRHVSTTGVTRRNIGAFSPIYPVGLIISHVLFAFGLIVFFTGVIAGRGNVKTSGKKGQAVRTGLEGQP